MKKIKTLRELQLVNIYIYRDLLNFCNKNDITIYLHGGSLIGAIRHNGFIPWDDDIDLCLSRTDYERLKEISHGKISDKVSLIDPEDCSEYNGYIPLVVYNNSISISQQYRIKEKLKIGISIFIYDGISSVKLRRKLYFRYMYLLRAMHALCRANFQYAHSKAGQKFGPMFQRFFNVRDVKKYKKKILNLQKKYKYNNSKYVSTNIDTDAIKEVCLKSSFEQAVPVIFEGIKSQTYSHYDCHLRKYYGDYMSYPPLEEQKEKHSFSAWVEESFDFDFLS